MRCHPCWDGDRRWVLSSCWAHQKVALLPSPQGRHDTRVMATVRVADRRGGLGLVLVPAHGGDMGTELEGWEAGPAATWGGDF